MIRVGLVGAGKMARHHARALGHSGVEARIVGVVDPNSEARAALGGVAGAAPGYESLTRLLERERVDVVHICTPAGTHVELARQALRAGCHLYIEKPFAITVSEADELFRLADERQLRVSAGHQLLYEPVTEWARTLLPALGRIAHIESYFSFRPVRRGTLSADQQLLDVLPHPTYLLLDLLQRTGEFDSPVDARVDLDGFGNVHALVSGGGATGSLCVTLSGRPVESYVRVVGTNGTIHVDYVRGTVQRLIGPGASGIDKALVPYRLGRQLLSQTTAALARRIRKRGGAYPGLVEILRAFYAGITSGQDAVPRENIRETTRIVESVARLIEHARRPLIRTSPSDRPVVVVTGGTGFLGSAVVRRLVADGTYSVRVLARRPPAPWETEAQVEYRACDLATDPLEERLAQATCVVHCAAETGGGWAEHERNSIVTVERLVRAMDSADVRHLVHISSVAVVAGVSGRPIDEHSPLWKESRAAGPYLWGKIESERAAREVGAECGVDVKVIRPGPILDFRSFLPPGRLGKRLGNFFVAVGGRNESLPVVSLERAAEVIAWGATHFEELPDVLHVVEPRPHSRRELVDRTRERNPGIRVVWVPRPLLPPLSALATLLQKASRPGRRAINLQTVFSARPVDGTRCRAILEQIRRESEDPTVALDTEPAPRDASVVGERR